MPAPASPREVFEELLRRIASGELGRMSELYTEDAVVDHPFALPEPTRTVGREALEQRLSAAPPVKLTARNVVVHETADPEVIVTEWDYDARVTTTGRTFSAANIQVMRVRNGKIVASRDYHNHAAFAPAFSGEGGVA